MDKTKRKKRLLTVAGCVLALLAVLALLVSVLQRCSDESVTVYSYDPFDHKSEFGYSEPEDDILADPEYAEKNRYMEVYDEESLNDASPSVKLLGKYFESAIKGDGKTLNSLFTDAYFENYGKTIEKYPDSFAAQKIYKIKVRLVDGPYKNENGASVTQIERFEVSFLLKDNNGQFRPDLPEPDDGTVPLVYEVITTDGVSLINAIVEYSYKEI